ncbi:hypothetical protein INT48_005185 [Thamnidium elegans]|uniref:General transcription factor 3C polypeptide 3 n=1 Tax=Thamnidium elegans TaxID=101142 RepID=A0A8H7SQT6_9FUNG|nr:hypothetical protein INT48_005185 [Thamnidium elegans]
MVRSTQEKGKGKEDDYVSKEESFAQLLMGGEEEFEGYLQENETLEDEPESNLDLSLEEEDEEDDDNDSLDAWIEDEDIQKELPKEEFIDDSEITDLLDNSAQQRLKLKTGGQDELEKDMEEFESNLALTSGIGIKNLSKVARKRALLGEIRLSDDIKRKLGAANGLYIARDYGAAIDILQDVIKENPNAHPAWNTLGLVHEELGNKEKSLQLRMVAAHMCNDTSLWKELGQKSIENDAIKQAIYCFTKALLVDPLDVDALWDRSFLHKQLGRSADAIAGFRKILEIMPHHFKVINELAQLYRIQGKTKEAIELYNAAIEYHKNDDDDDEESDNEEDENEFTDKLGYSEINMLSELYLILNDYRSALDTIKNGLRRIQHRQHEAWWLEHTDDDDEYMEDDESRTDFPIELRVRMGVCRIYLNQVRLGTKHFQYLLQYPATLYPDLHQDVAYAYYDKRHYDLALNVFQRIIDASNEIEVDLLIRTADCYHEVGELETAVVFYVNVLGEQPENLDVMMSLATVYEEQGKEEAALELVDFVMKKNRESRKLRKTENQLEDENEDLTSEERLNRAKSARKAKSKKASIFDETNHQTKADSYRQRRAEIQRLNEERDITVKGLFQKLSSLDKLIGDSLADADRSVIREYMKCAQDLWEDFSSTSAFYPDRRHKKFQGFYAIRKGKRNKKNDEGDANLNVEAHQMANRIRTRRVKIEGESDMMDLDEEEKSILEQEKADKELIESCTFRGLGYILALTKRTEEAYELMKKLYRTNVFYHDNEKKTSLKLALMGIGLVTKNEFIIQSGIRWLCNHYQFKNEPYRIYTAIMSGEKESIHYGSSSQLKYFTRTIRLMDAIVARNRKNSGETDETQPDQDEIRELHDVILAMDIDPSTTNEQDYRRYYHVPDILKGDTALPASSEDIKYVNPIVLSIFANIMNLNRNYIASSLFFMRAYAIAPNDSLNTLSLGISLLQASMQRKSDDRHLQIMQGMLFILEYVKLMGYCQESEYNLARAFHMLGLTHLAAPHYEKVLCLPSRKKMGIENEKPISEVYTWSPEDEEFYGAYEEEEYDETDLKYEAAYNLHLIYVTAGSMNLAQILFMKYCTI